MANLLEELTSAAISIALRHVVGVVKDAVGDRPIPPEFWDSASDIVGDLALRLIEAGPSAATDELVSLYGRRIHRLARHHGLIDTV